MLFACVLSPSWSPAVCSLSLLRCSVPSVSPSAPHHLISLVSSLDPSLLVGASVFALASVLCLPCLFPGPCVLRVFLFFSSCFLLMPHCFFFFFPLFLFYFPQPAFGCQILSPAISLFTFLGFLDLSSLKLAFFFNLSASVCLGCRSFSVNSGTSVYITSTAPPNINTHKMHWLKLAISYTCRAEYIPTNCCSWINGHVCSCAPTHRASPSLSSIINAEAHLLQNEKPIVVTRGIVFPSPHPVVPGSQSTMSTHAGVVHSTHTLLTGVPISNVNVGSDLRNADAARATRQASTGLM